MTKSLDQNVLEVLSGLTVRGPFVTIRTQLDRKMYLKVNEVLASIGGKWDRAAGTHIFESDPQEALDNVINTGEIVRDKDLGFFATPPELAGKLVQLAEVRPGMSALEPSAGEGAIVRALLDVDCGGVAYEIHTTRFLRLSLIERVPRDFKVWALDFMPVSPAEIFDRVVMNPPFCKVLGQDHLDHVQRAFEWLKPGGILVSVLPNAVSFRQDRRHREFRTWLKAHKGVLADLPPDSFKASGTRVQTVTLKMRKAP